MSILVVLWGSVRNTDLYIKLVVTRLNLLGETLNSRFENRLSMALSLRFDPEGFMAYHVSR